MTHKYAMKIIKAQLAKTPQNLEIFAKLDALIARFGDLDDAIAEQFGTQASHLLNHMRKIYKKDLEELNETQNRKK